MIPNPKKVLKSIKTFLWKVDETHKSWPDIYLIKWADPCSNIKETWLSSEQVQSIQPLVCCAAGFLLEKTPEAIKIACTVSANGFSGQIIAIPLTSITFIQKIVKN